MAGGRAEVLDLRVGEHRHALLAGEVGLEDGVAVAAAQQQIGLQRGGMKRLGDRGGCPAADPGDTIDRHGVLGVVPQRQREAHSDAAPRGVDRDVGRGSHRDLRGVDLGSGALWDEPVSQPGQVIVDLAACPDDYVVVSDKAMAGSGLRIFRGTTEVTTAPLGIGMPPGVGNNLVCF